jgi:ribosomal protein L4
MAKQTKTARKTVAKKRTAAKKPAARKTTRNVSRAKAAQSKRTAFVPIWRSGE